MTKYNLSIGFNDKDTKKQILEDTTIYSIIQNTLKEYLDGYTILTAFGGYKHDDSTFVEEKSCRVEILFANDMLIKLIVEKLKQLLNQESIAVEKIETNSELW